MGTVINCYQTSTTIMNMFLLVSTETNIPIENTFKNGFLAGILKLNQGLAMWHKKYTGFGTIKEHSNFPKGSL